MSFKNLGFTFILIFTFIYFLPIIRHPNIFLDRNNDLDQFFWPVYFFAKNHILFDRSLPFWNSMILSGTPLLPDPQSPLFYIPNFLFLIFPLNTSFIISLILHTLIGAFGMYLLASRFLRLSSLASFFVISIFVSNPKLAGYIEAGHFGLIQSLAWIPLCFFLALKLEEKVNLYQTVLLSVCLAAIFFTHTVTFFIVLFVVAVILLNGFIKKGAYLSLSKKFLSYSLIFSICLGLISITLLPQLEWIPNTTRLMLLKDRDVYPKWNGRSEFIESVVWPVGLILNGSLKSDSEKWIPIPISLLFLALAGFFTLKKANKIKLFIASSVIILIALNNVSPFYNFLLRQDWYILIRVATRFWIILYIIIILLAGLFAHKIAQKNIKVFILIVLITLTEQIYLSQSRINSPIKTLENPVSESIYTFLKNDAELYRVFCTTKCLSQKEVAKYNLQTIEGYNTLISSRYYQQSLQFLQTFWNYYSLSIPPLGISLFTKINPDINALADYNVKYIVSPYSLDNKNISLEKLFENYYIYKILDYKSRAYFIDKDSKITGKASVLVYSPNVIKIDTTNANTDGLVLAEVYSDGWNAYSDSNTKIDIQEKSDKLRFVPIPKGTKNITFKYQPQSFFIGSIITLITIILSVLLLSIKRLKKNVK